MRLSWGSFYVFLFLYRCLFSFLGQTVVLRLTDIPDTMGYQQATLAAVPRLLGSLVFSASFAQQRHAVVIVQAIAGSLSAFVGGNAVLLNIGFQAIACAGLIYLLMGVPPGPRRFLAVLLMFPSFTVWSSIVSKEAIVVFLVCVLGRYLIDIYNGVQRSIPFHILVVAPVLLLLFVFKPHFIPAILFAIAVPKIATMTRQPTTVAIFAAMATICALYVLRDPIDQFVLKTYRGIASEPGASNREGAFLVDAYDTYARAPLGMVRAFIGPTLSEAGSGVLHLASFVESIVIVVLLAGYAALRLPRVPVYMGVVSLFTIFWVMFANYPLGLANPGTAVRYRTDYIVLIYLAAVPLLSRAAYVRWRTLARIPARGGRMRLGHRRRPFAAVAQPHPAS